MSNKIFAFLLFLIFVVYPFGQLTRLSNLFNLPEVAFSILDALTFVFVVIWFVIRGRRKLVIPKIIKPGIYFLLIAFLSLLANYFNLRRDEFFVASLYLLRLITYFSYSLALMEFRKRFKKVDLTQALLIVGSFIALFGFVQLLIWPDLKMLEIYQWDPHYYRLAGTMFDPSFTGIIIVLTLIIAIVKLINKRSLLLILITLLVSIALIFTQSRASWLSFFIAFAILSFLKRAWKLYLIMMLLFVLFVWLIPKPPGEAGKLERTYSIGTRIGSWTTALEIARNHPILGVGFNAYRYARHQYEFDDEDWQFSHAGAGADSSFLLVLATTGILGLIAYVYWWLMIVKDSFLKRDSQVGLILLLSAVALIIHSFFNNTLFYPWVLVWFFTLISI